MEKAANALPINFPRYYGETNNQLSRTPAVTMRFVELAALKIGGREYSNKFKYSLSVVVTIIT
jgi:hypothetical protein